MSNAKHVPQRTCVGCRTTSVKSEFVRIVRTSEGAVDLDPAGKRNGRGAYLCTNRACWEEALKKDRLARALRTTITTPVREQFLRYAEQLEPAGATVGS